MNPDVFPKKTEYMFQNTIFCTKINHKGYLDTSSSISIRIMSISSLALEIKSLVNLWLSTGQIMLGECPNLAVSRET